MNARNSKSFEPYVSIASFDIITGPNQNNDTRKWPIGKENTTLIPPDPKIRKFDSKQMAKELLKTGIKTGNRQQPTESSEMVPKLKILNTN